MVPNSISKLDLVQAQISEIPEDWQLCKVSEALRIRNNFRKPISQEVRETMKGQYPYYGPTKIQDYISEYEQDGIYALIGEDGDHFLKYATMPQTQFISGKCTVNNHAHILESSSICDSEWFFNYFKHRNITNFLSRQGAGRFKLNKATLEKLPLLVPPLPEQRKIAQILSTWDRGIATTEKLIDASKQQKKALMQQLLTGKKRLIDPETGKAFEGEWENTHLSNIASIKKGKALSAKNLVAGSYPVIAGGKSSPYSHVDFTHENVITVSASGAYAGYVSYHPYKIWASDCSVVTAKPANYLGFIFQWLQLNQIRIYSMQSGGAQPHIYPKDLEVMKLRVPKVEEQEKIASVLTAADEEIKFLEAKLAYFKQEKKALMQQLLTGKRRVKV
ncbi:restriction endonuclease subunit S [Aliivibrio fischeri]|uniref:restriction endonuclease subunit S n=1 Tax=Aliivibrio fischeri TaxID=668 RepID=UPI0012D96A4A|nr:restriction endonuclease subunit S [Aliivibrio fischeri]MUK37857.1 restriction endonuclease subunit S [Aliivibrio fischeri]MUL07116.1 restriction endonuclease subunit S [Aliivibrio fischeri]